MDWRNILTRAAWTFVQAFAGGLASAPVVEAISGADLDSLGALALAGVAAGVGSLLSFVKTVAVEQLEKAGRLGV